jgi:hypothetical protein
MEMRVQEPCGPSAPEPNVASRVSSVFDRVEVPSVARRFAGTLTLHYVRMRIARLEGECPHEPLRIACGSRGRSPSSAQQPNPSWRSGLPGSPNHGALRRASPYPWHRQECLCYIALPWQTAHCPLSTDHCPACRAHATAVAGTLKNSV